MYFCLIIPSITGSQTIWGAGTDTSYTEAIIYENTISEVNRWNFYNTLTDTSIVAKDELLLSSLQARSAYIRGNLFLFTEISNHPANQIGQFLFVL